MENIRRDFLIERYSIISPIRGERPQQFPKPREKKGQVCFFCPGNEKLTPPTLDRFPRGGPWQIRVFRNKFPALKPPKGDHEIVVDTSQHGKELEDLEPERILQALRMYEKRRKFLETKHKYVSVFKNKGKEAGASLLHSHAQLIAGPLVPSVVARENEASRAHYKRWHRCAWCDYIDGIGRDKKAAETQDTIAVTANAPRFPYEVWLMPKAHARNFSDLGPSEALDFCAMLKEILLKLRGEMGHVPYNLAFHHSQKGNGKWYHFHVEVLPRVSTHAGYELGEGAYISAVSPEAAARFYRRSKA